MQLRRTIYLVCALFITGHCHSQKVDVKSLASSVLFKGESITAYRDPMVYIDKGTLYCYFTLIQIEVDGKIYMYTAFSENEDLKKWSPIVKITPQSQVLDFSSPGNIIRHNGQYIMCLQTYPRPGYTVDQMPKYDDTNCRFFIMRSNDWNIGRHLKYFWLKTMKLPKKTWAA